MLMFLLLLGGVLVFIVGGIMLLIAAFTVSIWWGIACLLLPPLMFLFIVLNWAKAKKPLLVQFVGVVLVIASGVMMGDALVSSLRNQPFSSYKQYTWSATTVTPPAQSVQGSHQCITQNGSIVVTNQPCELGESAIVGPAAADTLPSLPQEHRDAQPVTEVQLTPSNNTVRCDGRTHCSQMTSCEEATFFLNHCPNTQMDGNNDGVPCESQWCGI